MRSQLSSCRRVVALSRSGRRPRVRGWARVAAVTLAIAGASTSLQAQTAPPTLQKVSPTGAQRGTRARITLTGTNIAGATRIIFSEPGFTATIADTREVVIEKPVVPKEVVRTDAPIDDKAKKYEVSALVTIAADVPHGIHAFRLQTPLGVSNLLRFAVSSLPEISEREPNTAEAPLKVTLPAALVGALEGPGDVDAYEFRARAGEAMVFQVVARPIGARLDSVIRLLDANGRTLAENNDVDLSRDSVLTRRFTETGTYVLAIEDIEHGGGGDGFRYRIYAGAVAYVTGLFPLGVAKGEVAEISVAGVNLSTEAVHVRGDRAAVVGRTIPVTAATRAGPALNRKVVALGAYSEALEAEPNDEPALAPKLAIPSTVNGRVWTSTKPDSGGSAVARGDRDVFRFSARKGQKLVFDVMAQQLGSPLDSMLEVLDANGRVVPRAVVRCVAQTEVALNDPDSTRRGFRLAAWNEFAINDYLMAGDELLQVESMPTHPDDDLIFKSYRGMRAPLLDTSTRTHSVGEPVYKVEIHPPDTRLEPNGMPVFRIDYVNDDGGPRFGGKDSRLHFEAPQDGDYFVRLRDVRGLDGEPFAYRLTIREPAPDFDLTFSPASFNIPRGGRVSVTITAERTDGFDGAIDVEARDLPPGLTATAARIPAGAATTVIMVAAAPDASFERVRASLDSMYPKAGEKTTVPREFDVPGLVTLKIAGRSEIAGQTVVREAQPMEPIPGVALAPRPDLVVTTDAARVELPAGRQVSLTVTVERHNGFTGRVPVNVMNLPHGVRVDDIGLNGVMITEQETTRTIHIVAEPWVEAQSQPILVVGRVEVNSPLRNEAAALPVELVITRVTTAASR